MIDFSVRQGFSAVGLLSTIQMKLFLQESHYNVN